MWPESSYEAKNRLKINGPKIIFQVPEDAANLIKRLLNKQARFRLGGGPRDAAEVMEHPFFESIDWVKLENKELPVSKVNNLRRY